MTSADTPAARAADRAAALLPRLLPFLRRRAPGVYLAGPVDDVRALCDDQAGGWSPALTVVNTDAGPVGVAQGAVPPLLLGQKLRSAMRAAEASGLEAIEADVAAGASFLLFELGGASHLLRLPADAPAADAGGPPPIVAAMLPALGPLLGATLGVLRDGEALVAGAQPDVDGLGLAPTEARRELATEGGPLAVDAYPLGELVTAAVLAGRHEAATDLGALLARAGGGALCAFVLPGGGWWWTRVRPEAPPPSPAAQGPAAPRPAPRVVLELSLPCALAWLRLLAQWSAFGPAVNGAPLVELRDALESALGAKAVG